VAANRFILEAPIADAFTQKLVTAVGKLVTGRGSDPTTDVGPVIDDRAVAKIRGLVEDALQRGATLLLGSRPKDWPEGSRLISPIVLSGITADMALWKTEVFGPVIGLRTAATEDDAIVQANDTDAGLIAYVYTSDGARQQRMAETIEAGMIGINEGLVSTAQAPFGGIKHSGIGREGSRHGIDDYTNWKYIATRIG
jgi:succinate-semialdehyde dehydrogenase/glutarate-semialdehyde dehydrogenase